MRSNRAVNYGFVVCIIVFAALVLRGWGLAFGLPNTKAQPDESLIADTAVNVLRGHPHPGFFNYPSLFIYTDAAAAGAYCVVAAHTGRFDSFRACVGSWPSDWTPFFMSGRILSAVAGTSAVLLVLFVGARLVPHEGSALAGAVSAAMLATAFLHVRDSHFGVTDVTMTTALLLAVWCLLRADTRPTRLRFLVAGLAAGVATGTKYNAVLLGAAVVVSQLLAMRRDKHPPDWRIPVFTAGLLVGFAVTSPFAVVDRQRFAADVLFEAHHLAVGHGGIASERGWIHHALVTLPLGVGWPLFICGVCGIAVALTRNLRAAALVFTFPLIYYVVAGRGLTVFARYMIPVVPFLCLGVGALVAAIHDWSGMRGRASLGTVLNSLVVVACILPNAMKSVALDRELARTDSRVIAADWINAHVQPNESVYLSGSEWGRPDLWRRGAPPPFRVVDQWNGGLRPDWIVVQESPLVLYNGPVRSDAVPASEYEQRLVVIASNPAVTHVYDQQDAFFLPLDGFDGVARPGPNFRIFERRR